MRGILRVGGAWFTMGNRRRFSMAKAIALRADHGADGLRRLARASRDAARTRRLLALAAIQDGASRTEAARIGGVGLQIVCDWVRRLNAEGPTGLVDRKAPGKPPLLTPEQGVSDLLCIGLPVHAEPGGVDDDDHPEDAGRAAGGLRAARGPSRRARPDERAQAGPDAADAGRRADGALGLRARRGGASRAGEPP